MDYDYLNGIYESIIKIVNEYVAKNYYLKKVEIPYSVASKLSLALLGYYLVLGEDIFKKINIILDSVEIVEYENRDDFAKKASEYQSIRNNEDLGPAFLKWEHRYDKENNFLGSIPHIHYQQHGLVSDVLSIVHELSHAIEGLGAKVSMESDTSVYIAHGFVVTKYEKSTGNYKSDDMPFVEFVTSSLESRVLQKFLLIDRDKVHSPSLKDFLREAQKGNNKNLDMMSSSTNVSNLLLKDLIENDAFFNLIMKYFYDNDEMSFKEEFESYSSELYYSELKRAIVKLYDDPSLSTIKFYEKFINAQVKVFNAATGYKPSKKILILV